ncbi:hypothetical protein Tco_1374189 [Tanacetum coccineum]
MTRSSTNELLTPLDNPKKVFQIKRRLFEKPGLGESSLPRLGLFSDIEEHSEEEATKIMMETMKQYMSKTRGDYGSGVTRPKIDGNAQFKLKGNFSRNFATILSVEHNSRSNHSSTLPCISYWSRKPLDKEPTIRLVAIQAQLNNLRREIKKVNEKVYAAQVGCELCKGPHYTKDYPLKEDGKTLEEAYYT